jgi:hypothetical protein
MKTNVMGLHIQRTGLIGGVLEDNVALLVLVLAQRDQDDVAVVDPDLFPELAADQAEALDTVEALQGLLAVFPLSCESKNKHTIASSLPFPNILRTCAYSCPSSLNVSSRFSLLFFERQ